ncbi:MAG: phosphopantothenoylcysteine decarboxylase [Planctomycetota bacterium]
MTRRPTVLISAGPTREYIDDVRFLSNASSGRMGRAVAVAALEQGCQVHLALGPVAPLDVPDGIEIHGFTSARDLDDIARNLWPDVDAFVATAAVADYRPAARIPGKRKKGDGTWQLELVRNPDVLSNRGAEKGARTLVGFALEADPTHAEARRKLVQKGLDLIILNSTANLGSTGGDFDWIEAAPRAEETGNAVPLRGVTKQQLATRIVDFLLTRYEPS